MSLVDVALVGAAALLALMFRPWASLRTPTLRAPLIPVLVLLPCLWAAQTMLPTRLPLQLSGACLLVLMFGWPLAVLLLVPIAIAGAWLGGDPARSLELAAWCGVVPATLGLMIGIATRRWLPNQMFIYILGRGFFTTALAMGLAGGLHVWVAPPAHASEVSTLLIADWLIAWGEAFATGALTAIFVAFRPGWLQTYSDARYLPPRAP